VTIEYCSTPKPFIGGFRNKKTGIVYHHAFAQTDQVKKDHKLKFHRDTQTYYQSTKSIKLKREFGTQMEREGLFIDTRSDKPMTPQLYFNSELWDIRRDEAALFIQRIIRGMLARMRAKNLLTLKEQNKQMKLKNEEEKRK
jgi:hypothetical protein